MTHKILITGALDPLALEIFSKAKDVSVDYKPDIPYAEVLKIIGDYHAHVSRSETDVTAEMIDKGVNLKVIARAAVGIGNIAVEHATEKGILVINTPGKNTNSAAELAWALLLAAMRKVVSAHLNVAGGGWNRHKFTGSELMGRTIGIIGLGNVGHRVARFANGFDMKVLAYDPYIADEVFESHQAQKVDLATLLAQSDVVSLHVPKTKETTNMISAKEIALMKDGAVLLNTARGGVVNEKALVEALTAGKLSAAGIDTFDVEPPKDNPLAKLDNVVLTPHIGASTLEAQLRIAESISTQTIRALRGEVVDYPVNMPRMKSMMTPLAKYYTVLAEKLGVIACQSLTFNPRQISLLYRGALKRDEGELVRMAFLKGFLTISAGANITFVNADKTAAQRGIQVQEDADPGFADYHSAVKVVITDNEHTFTIGGVVFGENNYRLSLINNFAFEVVPEGHMLTMVNRDRPGVIGKVGTLLAEGEVNISQFELARNRPGGEAMSVIRVDSPVPEAVIAKIRELPFVLSVVPITV
ncbi:MAG: phosphoglycerate dehydrogenase [Deltaproteobacteria bacterium]|nr:phosphoglycerate dehydrogenase [Deltaproteobacteria bacterium]